VLLSSPRWVHSCRRSLLASCCGVCVFGWLLKHKNRLFRRIRFCRSKQGRPGSVSSPVALLVRVSVRYAPGLTQRLSLHAQRASGSSVRRLFYARFNIANRRPTRAEPHRRLNLSTESNGAQLTTKAWPAAIWLTSQARLLQGRATGIGFWLVQHHGPAPQPAMAKAGGVGVYPNARSSKYQVVCRLSFAARSVAHAAIVSARHGHSPNRRRPEPIRRSCMSMPRAASRFNQNALGLPGSPSKSRVSTAELAFSGGGRQGLLRAL